MSLQSLKETIDKLDQEATPGPWYRDKGTAVDVRGPDEIKIAATYGLQSPITTEAYDEMVRRADANGNFIAFARTALPQLLRIAEELGKERDDLKLKLRKANQTIDDLNQAYIDDNI